MIIIMMIIIIIIINNVNLITRFSFVIHKREKSKILTPQSFVVAE
jgi:hypothetical protein